MVRFVLVALLSTALVAALAIPVQLETPKIVPSGIAFALATPGFQFLGSEVVDLAISKMQSLPLPDVPETKVDCEGHCFISVSGATLTGLKCGAPTFKFASGGAQLNIPACTATVKDAAWHLHRSTFPGFSCHGSLDLTVTGVQATGTVTANVTANHSLALGVSAASVKMDDDHIDFHGGDCGWLTGLIKGAIEKAVVNGINGQLDQQLPDLINSELSQMAIPTSIMLKDNITDVDLGLEVAPSFTASAMVVDVAGDVVDTKAASNFSWTCPAVENLLPANSSAMAGLSVSPCVPNAALFSFFEEGRFAFDDVIDFKGTNLTASVVAHTAPSLTFSAGDAAVHINGSLSLTEGNKALLSADVAGQAGFVIAVKDLNITAHVEDVDLSGLSIVVTFHDKDIPLHGKIVEDLVELTINKAVLPKVNSVLDQGFPLPALPGFSLQGPQIELLASGILVETAFVKQT